MDVTIEITIKFWMEKTVSHFVLVKNINNHFLKIVFGPLPKHQMTVHVSDLRNVS